MPYVKAERVLVNVQRDITHTGARIAYRHEVPILEVIHGEGSVTVIEDPGTHDVEVIQPVDPLDAAAEFGRLSQAYGMHPEIAVTVAEFVYGREVQGIGQNFVAMLGGPVDAPAARPRERIGARPQPAPQKQAVQQPAA